METHICGVFLGKPFRDRWGIESLHNRRQTAPLFLSQKHTQASAQITQEVGK